MSEVWMCFLMGVSVGFAIAWVYFLWAGLIRTREEYYAARKGGRQ